MFSSISFAHADAIVTGFREIIVKTAGFTFFLPIRFGDFYYGGSFPVGFHLHMLPISCPQRVTLFVGSAQVSFNLSTGHARLKSDSLVSVGCEEQNAR